MKAGTTTKLVEDEGFVITDNYIKLIIDALIQDDRIQRREWKGIFPFGPTISTGELIGDFFVPFVRKRKDATPDEDTKSIEGWISFFMDKLEISEKGAAVVFHELCNWSEPTETRRPKAWIESMQKFFLDVERFNKAVEGYSRYVRERFPDKAEQMIEAYKRGMGRFIREEVEPGFFEMTEGCRNLERVGHGLYRTDRGFFETKYGVVDRWEVDIKEVPKEMIQYRGLLRWTSWVTRQKGIKKYDDYWTIYVWWKFPPNTPDNVLSEFFEDALNEVLKQIRYYGKTAYTARTSKIEEDPETGAQKTTSVQGKEYEINVQSIAEHWGDATDAELHGDWTYETTTDIRDDGVWVQLFRKGGWPDAKVRDHVIRSSEDSGYKRVFQGGK